MKTSLFDYKLPERFIAQEPVSPRDHSKLMIYDSSSEGVYHKHFYNLLDNLNENDVLVINESKVIPARIIFYENLKECEIFLLRDIGEFTYKVLVRPGRFFKKHKKFLINDEIYGEIIEVLDDGTRVIKFNRDVKCLGKIPLPPYIKNSNTEFSKYQTVYAEREGSVAAPTAGLHFTNKLLENLKNKGVDVEKVLLHVGLGTFLPVKSEEIEDHKMHSEFYELPENVSNKLNIAKKKGKRIIAVGTTSVRVLESSYIKGKGFVSKCGETDIFIYPGYKWKTVDALVTNFHLPKSTLLMLVASFLESKGVKNGQKKLLELYSLAKKKNYRFYSFGDAMFLF